MLSKELVDMKRFICIIQCFFICLLLTQSCTEEDSPNPFMSFDNSRFVDVTANEIALNNAKEVSLPDAGVWEVQIIDDYLVTTNFGDKGLISVFSFPDLEKLGSFFDKGNGPFELRETLSFSRMRVVSENGQTNIYIPDGKNNIINFDLTDSALFNQLSATYKFRDIPHSMFLNIFIDDSTAFCKNLAGYSDKQERFIYVNDTLIVPESMAILNETTVPVQNDDFMFNAITTAFGYNPQFDIVAEASIYMNNINLYGIRNDIRKTLYIGKKISVNDVCHGGGGMKRMITMMQPYDDMFAILTCNKRPTIVAFDWDGNYMFTLVIPDKEVSCFGFDFKRHTVYTFDSDSETMKIYDCPAI